MKIHEDIQRIKEVMGIISERLDDINGEPLYHKTSTDTGLKIIGSNSLIGTKPSDDYLDLDKRLRNTKTQSSISFTRDKNWQPDQSIGKGSGESNKNNDIIFVVDKLKLQTNYKVEPFNYYGLDSDYSGSVKGGEFEERVLTDMIYPLSDYLIDVIYLGDDDEVQTIVNDYKNNELTRRHTKD